LSRIPLFRTDRFVSRARLGTLAVALLAAGLTGAWRARQATVRGIVVRAGTETPIPGALVSIVDEAGRVLGLGVTGGDGRFQLEADTRGPFSLRIEAIGLRSVEAGPWLEPPAGDRRFEVPAAPIRLASLPDAPDAGLCRLRPGPGTAAGQALTEVRKALEIEAWARSVNHFTYDVFQYERRVGAGDRVESERGRRIADVVGAPSRSRPPAELAEQGYARTAGRGDVLFAPDVDVLLSPEFAADHCYRVIGEGAGSAALVGLAFSPARSPDNVDVEGVFWLNARTAELRSLEFGYTGLEEPDATRRATGGIDFVHLPGGLWAVARSWVRTPAPGGDDEYREEGIEVVRVTPPDGDSHAVIARAGLVGTVRDRAGGEAYEGATVELLGTPYNAVTNVDGRFFIPGLPPGRYRLSFRVPGLEQRPEPRDVWLGPNQTTLVDLDLTAPRRGESEPVSAPTAADSIRFYLRSLGIATTQRVDSLIYDALTAKEEGRLLGRVVDQSTGRPIAGALLSLPGVERTALTESDGSFLLGDVPAGRYIMDSQMLGYSERRDTVEVLAGLVIEAQVALATQAIELAPISVTVRSRWLDQNGFYSRRTDGMAGHFFTREDILDKGLTQFTELFRDVPGVSVIHAQTGMTSIRFRRLHRMTADAVEAVRGCEPGVYYDGIPMNTSIDRLDMIALPFVEGVEVYVGAATPIQFQHPCGVILVWTHRPR
jgi:hypothetical protein